jgi:uncharacterized protein (TIRG00374 family)
VRVYMGILGSKKAHSLLGFLVSFALVAWMVWSMDWKAVGGELSRFQWWALLPSTALLVGHFYLRAWRWRYLLPAPAAEERPVSIQKLFDCLIVGAFATFILPLRAGEFVRPFLLTRLSSYPFSSAFVSVVVERFFDLAVVLLSFAVVVALVPNMPPWVQGGVVVLSSMGAGIFALMVAGSFFPKLVLAAASRMLAFAPQKVRIGAENFLSNFLDGAAVLKHGGRLLSVIALSCAVWGSCYVLYIVYFWLLDADSTLLIATTIAVIVALAVAAPSAPGFIGVYQVAMIAGFSLFGLPEQQAVAYSIITHLLQYVLFVVYGMFVLMRSHLSLGELRPANTPAEAS